MNRIEGYFKGLRTPHIYYQAWLPDGEVKAGLMFVHGLGCHSGRYMNVIRQLVPGGIAVYGHDHIGHGRSAGERMLYEKAESRDKMITLYEGMYHETLTEPERGRVLDDMETWLAAHIA